MKRDRQRLLDGCIAAVLGDDEGNPLRDFAWQGGYAAFTVSTSQKERVSQYIAKQREHHGVLSYRDELLALLKAHEMEFDENYFLD